MKKTTRNNFKSRFSLLLIFGVIGLLIVAYNLALPKLSTQKVYAQNSLGPKTGVRWIDTQADKMGLRDKEVVLKDAYSTHFKNADGTVTGLFTGFKQNYEASPGVWEPIDYSLEKSHDPRYDYQTKNGVGLYLSKNGSITQKNGDSLLESGAPSLGLYNPVSNSFTKLNNLDNPRINKTDNYLTLDGQDVKLVAYALDIGTREDLVLENSTLVDNANLDDLLTLKAAIDSTGSLTLNGQPLDTKYNPLTGGPNPKYELTTKDALVLTDNGKTTIFPFPEGHDAKDNPATIRRFLIKEGNTWYLYTSVPVSWLKKINRSYPVTIDPDFAGTTADGSISGSSTTYSTARGTGGTVGTTQANGTVGQKKVLTQYTIYRSFLEFTTSSIPDSAVINQVNLTMVMTADNSTVDFTTNVVDYNWNANDPLTTSNMDAAYDGCLAATIDNSWKNSSNVVINTQYASANLSTSWITKDTSYGGSTYYCLSSNKDTNNTAPAGREDINLGMTDNTTAGYRPVLTITYQPAQVTATAATSITATSFSANWNTQSASGANGYTLDVATDSGFTSFVATGCAGGSCNAKAVGNVTTYSVTGLSASTTYYYRVRATDSVGGGTGANSGTITVLTAPAAPTVNAATSVTTSSFSANWSASTGATGYYLDVAKDSSFTDYSAPLDTACGGVCQNKNVLNLTTYSVTGLNAGTPYYYRVRAYNSGGTSTSAGFITVYSVPNAPTANAATNVTATSFSANWSAPTGATGYYFDVAKDSGFTDFTSPLTSACGGTSCNNAGIGNVTTYSVTSLTCGINYYYRVRGINGGGTSSSSNTINPITIPCAPTSPGATNITTSSFSANWSASTGATGYRLDVSADNFSTYLATGCAGGSCENKDVGNVTTYSVTGLTAGTPYYYRIRAYNTGGTSSSSSTINPITVPSSPVASPATNDAATGFSANWSASTGATGYYLDVANDSGFTSYTGAVATACGGTTCNNKSVGNVITYSVTSLTCGTNYYYRVRATNTGGTSSSSNTINPITIPCAPTANAATSVTTSSFSANWSASTGATGYRLDVAKDSGFTDYSAPLDTICGGASCNNKDVGSVTTYSVTPLSANTNYYYRLRAYNTGGTSVSSSTINPLTLPGNPTSSAATSVGETSYSANWSAPSGNGAITSYRLDVALTSNFSSGFLTGCGGASCNDYNVGNVITYSIADSCSNLTPMYYRVRAVNATGTSVTSSSVITVTRIACAPDALPQVSPESTESTIIARWTAAYGATGYRLDVAKDSGFTDYTAPLTTACAGSCNNKDVGNTTSYTPTGLAANTTYYYRLRSYNATGTSGNSVTRNRLTAPAAPVATTPTNQAGTSFSANWNASTGATGYRLDVATDSGFTAFVTGFNNLDVGNFTTKSVTGLTNGTTYYYRVRAYNTGGTSSSSNVITLPGAPTATAATSITTTSFSANWNASGGATGYYLDVAKDSGFTNYTAPLDTACGGGSCNNKSVGDVTTYSVTSLTAGTTYYYRVRASSASATSNSSNTITVATVPPAPTASPATSVTATSFSANWNASTGATGYYLDVSALSNFSTFLATSCAGGSCNNLSVGNVTTYSVTSLTCGTNYYYRVRATNTGGTSTSSSTINPLTIPCAPTATAATSITTTSLTANWNASTGADGYILDVATDVGFTSFVASCDGSCNGFPPGNVTSYTITGLSGNTTYYYRVKASNTGGISGVSNTISQLTAPGAPTSPPGATNITATSFSANWSASTGATGYYLDVSALSNFSTFLATSCAGGSCQNVPVAGTTYSVTSLTAGTTYYYRVRAYNTGGTSTYSSTITVLLLPPAVTANAATNVTGTSFSANWSAATSATNYKLSVSTVATCDGSYVTACGGASCNLIATGNVTTYAVTPLSVNTTYYYCLKATNGTGDSATISNIISQLTAPGAPTSPGATNITATSFSANWSAPAGATGYYLDVAKDSGFTDYSAPLNTACGGGSCNNKDVGNVTTYSVTSLTAGNTYYFRVRARNGGGTGSNSSTITVNTLLSAPTANAATSINESSFTGSWGAVTGATSYKLSVTTNSDCSTSPITSTDCGGGTCSLYNIGNVTSKAITNGLSANSTYYYCLKATNANGDSALSNIVTVLTAPAKPTNLTLGTGNISDNGFSFYFTGAAGAATYKVMVDDNSDFSSPLASYNPASYTTTNAYVNGLTSGTTYYFKASSANSAGSASTYTTPLSMTTRASVPTVSVSNIQPWSFQANWSTVTGATNYYLEVARDVNFYQKLPTYGFSGTAGTPPGHEFSIGTVSASVQNLLPLTTYYFRVRSKNLTGYYSLPSSTQSVETTNNNGTSGTCNTGTGDTTFAWSCTPADATSFVSGGNLTIGSGNTLTLTNQNLVWDPDKKIDIGAGATILINNGSKLQQGYTVYADADDDGYPDSLSPTIMQTIPNGYKAPYQMSTNGWTTLDCDPTLNTAYSDCSSTGNKNVFYTADTYTGAQIGGLSGADAICQSQATSYGLNGTYVAWLSNATTPAPARITPAPYKYTLVDGTVVANNFGQFTDPSTSLLNPINQSPIGNVTSPNTSIWTNTTSTGTVKNNTAGGTCQNWTSASASYTGNVGSYNLGTKPGWTDNSTTQTCDVSRSLYCIQQ